MNPDGGETIPPGDNRRHPGERSRLRPDSVTGRSLRIASDRSRCDPRCRIRPGRPERPGQTRAAGADRGAGAGAAGGSAGAAGAGKPKLRPAAAPRRSSSDTDRSVLWRMQVWLDAEGRARTVIGPIRSCPSEPDRFRRESAVVRTAPTTSGRTPLSADRRAAWAGRPGGHVEDCAVSSEYHRRMYFSGNGEPSLNQPIALPLGHVTPPTSRIDARDRTAREVLHFAGKRKSQA